MNNESANVTVHRAGYDLIGDIHGHAATLRLLLNRLGYRETHGRYAHPTERRVIFLGDFIDRGPAVRETLHIVRAMVEAGTALAVMGNHEFNALGYHTHDPRGQSVSASASIQTQKTERNSSIPTDAKELLPPGYKITRQMMAEAIKRRQEAEIEEGRRMGWPG